MFRGRSRTTNHLRGWCVQSKQRRDEFEPRASKPVVHVGFGSSCEQALQRIHRWVMALVTAVHHVNTCAALPADERQASGEGGAVDALVSVPPTSGVAESEGSPGESGSEGGGLSPGESGSEGGELSPGESGSEGGGLSPGESGSDGGGLSPGESGSDGGGLSQGAPGGLGHTAAARDDDIYVKEVLL